MFKVPDTIKKQKSRRFRKIIDKIYKQEIRATCHPILSAIADAFKDSIDKKILLKLLLHVEATSNLLTGTNHIQAIAALANHHESWIRPFYKCSLNKHNSDRQFSELARHLLADYEVPIFMDSVWFNGNETHQEWFIHIGTGQNIRTARDMPIRLTKKMAHHFLKAPRHYTIAEALRWAQIHGLGGDRSLADALRETRLTQCFGNDAFWLNVIRFFIANPMLDVSHVHPIIDYIWHQKYENRRVFVERGVAREMGPAQPNFSMRGRTPETLLRQVEAWQAECERAAKFIEWERSGIGAFDLEEDQNSWSIRELLNSDELKAESEALQHCAEDYTDRCLSGFSSLWSVEVTDDEDARRKLLTVEVQPRERMIEEVRGLSNRLPTEKEKTILEKWAAQEGLEFEYGLLAAFERAG